MLQAHRAELEEWRAAAAHLQSNVQHLAAEVRRLGGVVPAGMDSVQLPEARAAVPEIAQAALDAAALEHAMQAPVAAPSAAPTAAQPAAHGDGAVAEQANASDHLQAAEAPAQILPPGQPVAGAGQLPADAGTGDAAPEPAASVPLENVAGAGLNAVQQCATDRPDSTTQVDLHATQPASNESVPVTAAQPFATRGKRARGDAVASNQLARRRTSTRQLAAASESVHAPLPQGMAA